MTDKKDLKEVLQVGSICPNCKENRLKYVGASFPYSEEYLWCDEIYKTEENSNKVIETGIGCNSTYNLKYKIMWQDDVNSLACDMHDVFEAELKKRGYTLTGEKSDKVYDKLTEMLDEFGTSDYKSHH